LLNKTSSQVLNWNSSLIRIQKLTNQSIRHKINHLKIYKCKTYSLLEKINISTRDNKLRSRAFVDYLIDYNSINIFRIWNLEKDDVSDYRNVIFDESELYSIYNKKDRLISLQKEKTIDTNIYNSVKISINQVIKLDSDDDKWLKITIRDRLVLEERRPVEKKHQKLLDSNQAQWVDSLLDSFSKLNRLIQSKRSLSHLELGWP
jgi:hypothetical protein